MDIKLAKSLTLTIVANISSNYGESLGNTASVQKVYRNQKEYAVRSRESLKNAICEQAGLYDDLATVLNKEESGNKKAVAQKKVDVEVNAANCRALEGGYMTTSEKMTHIRKSSFYITDAISVDPLINELRFHNNLQLANNYAKANGLNVQNKNDTTGLMPYQYEYDKSLKVYSITIDLERIGVDENFKAEADNQEKVERVNSILSAVETLSLIVKGNMDNAEPIFVIGGLSTRKTHFFENVVKIINNALVLEEGIENKLNSDIGNFKAGVLKCGQLDNENDIINQLNAKTTSDFFSELRTEIDKYYS
ncbi:MAG: type I-B CRISPR-associated protein Cas7/Cst2/DevR [Clostridium sp.]|nr:type I-B CRISPR-associated protein Cas7/Cst2/DevR [Clostridium sp.]